jgi:hypothetical protein
MRLRMDNWRVNSSAARSASLRSEMSRGDGEHGHLPPILDLRTAHLEGWRSRHDDLSVSKMRWR